MQPANFNKTEILEKLTPLIENTAMRYNMIPIEIDFSKESGKWFLRIFLYKDSGVTLDDCENVSRSLNPFLDELIPVKFYLEVSSPGLERKLKSDKEFIIFNGKTIDLKLKSLIDGTDEKHFLCKILDFDIERGLTVLKLDDNKEYTIPKDKITSERNRTTRFWTGDVFKIVLILKKYRPDLEIYNSNAKPSGLVCVKNLDSSSSVLSDNYEKIVEEFMNTDYSDIEHNKSLQLFVKDVEGLYKFLKI